MTEQAKSTEQLRNEIMNLRRENEELIAQLAFHRKVFREVNMALGVTNQLSDTFKDDDAVQQIMEENERLKSQIKIFRLTEREKEILKFIVKGLTSKEIAIALNLSKLTVDTHRKNIQSKLGVSNVVELVKMAIQSNIL